MTSSPSGPAQVKVEPQGSPGRNVNAPAALRVPPRLTGAFLEAATTAGFVPRKWHLESQYFETVQKSASRYVKAGEDGKVKIDFLGDDHESLCPKDRDRLIFLTLEGGERIRKQLDHGSGRGFELSADEAAGGGCVIGEANPVVDEERSELSLLLEEHREAVRVYFDVDWSRALKRNGNDRKNLMREDTKASFTDIASSKISSNDNRASQKFTYAELFAGIGGFRFALDALGGQCLLACEIDAACREVYERNFQGADQACCSSDGGRMRRSTNSYDFPDDIRKVAALPQNCDLLVGGFPCQPFSGLGPQAGIADDSKRGELFMEIVRLLTKPKKAENIEEGGDGTCSPPAKKAKSCLQVDEEEDSRPEIEKEQLVSEEPPSRRFPTVKAFLLENVPGLLETNNGADFKRIVEELQCGGLYEVHTKVLDAKWVTAQRRRRLYFVGIQKDLLAKQSKNSKQAGNVDLDFVFPDLERHFRGDDLQQNLRLGNVVDFEDDDEDRSTRASLATRTYSTTTLSSKQFSDLQQTSSFRRDFRQLLLFPKTEKCGPLVSHYGHHASSGNSQLVAQRCPLPPRLMTTDECLRVMGFPGSSSRLFRWATSSEQDPKTLRERYRMIGNAVAPPLIAALVGAVLDETFDEEDSSESWREKGLSVARMLALEAVTR
ncbi:unnamed protein product [Amoebophrya sp. A25]|nr:unnamed protein product [Amoebophrya sp. A25]|eukprot:GSA25T00008779001.1